MCWHAIPNVSFEIVSDAAVLLPPLSMSLGCFHLSLDMRQVNQSHDRNRMLPDGKVHDEKGYTALHMAAKAGHTEVMTVPLLDCPHAQGSHLEDSDHYATTTTSRSRSSQPHNPVWTWTIGVGGGRRFYNCCICTHVSDVAL